MTTVGLLKRISLGILAQNRLSVFVFHKVQAPPLVAALAMFSVVIMVRGQIEAAAIGLTARFAILTVTGALTYWLGIFLIARQHWGDVRDVISRIRAK